jgi:microcystin-dependent protein
MAFTQTWSAGFEVSPAGSDNSNFGASEMRSVKEGWRERFAVSHDMETNNNYQGFHKYSIQTVTSDTAISQKDIIKVITSAANITLTFPTVASCRGTGTCHVFLVSHSLSLSKAYIVTCTAQAGETFDITGTASFTLGGIGQAAIFVPQAVANTWSVQKLTIVKDMIIMWSGAIADIPYGWALCDGTNGTPDMKGTFIVGFDSTDTDYDTIGKTGGIKLHPLTISQMPAHTHQYYRKSTGGGSDGVMGARTGSTPTNSTGGGTGHENRPPYYTLAYIMKL